MDEEAAVSVRFGTDGWRAPQAEITPAKLHAIARALCAHLAESGTDGPIAVGYDARVSSREYAEELARAIASRGRNVTLPTRDCPTPVLAWTVREGSFAAGMMVTASHNPPRYNGVKIVTVEGAPTLPAVTDRLEELLAPPTPIEDEFGGIQEEQWIDRYVGAVLEQGQRLGAVQPGDESSESSPLDGFTVAYDAMYGSGRGVTDVVLAEAGATVDRYHCERDPDFGGQPPEPKPETATTLVEAVSTGEADVGIINDGDADRVGIVTPDRGYLDPNVVLALIYEYLVAEGGGDVVRTVSTSSLVDRIAAAHEAAVHETPVGFKWVAQAMQSHGALVGGEESGGYGITDHLPNKDGILIALVACLATTERPLDERIETLFETYGSISQSRSSLDCPDEHKASVLDAIEGDIEGPLAGRAIETVSNADGFKVHLDDGSWLLVRPSGTEPKLRLYAEAEYESAVEELLAAGREVVEPIIEELAAS